MKYSDGVFDKYKTRLVLLGHPGNVQPGQHWEGSKHAGTPSIDIARIFVALCVYFGWIPDYFDAKTAFLNGRCKGIERVGIRMPPELRQYDRLTGEEIYAILEASLYGHPIAALRWSEERDTFTLWKFNRDGWTAICMVDREPCLFFLTSPRPTGNRLIMVTHTDDFRVAGDNQDDVAFVVSEFDKKFGITTVTTGVMLGVKVDSGVDENGVRWTELTQTDYIKDLYSMASEYMPPNYKVSSPYPTDSEYKLSLRNKDGTCNKPPADEVARTHAKQFRTFVGMLLWICRNTKIALCTGLSFLTRVMSCPGDKAFYCLLHMIQYVYQERDTGLMFRSDRSVTPVSWYDASDDRDPADSVTVGGGLISMCGAAVNYNCGKLLHVGNAGSSHAEYMELERTIRSVIWLRELMRAAQIFRLCTGTTINNNFGKISRLHNGTPVYADVTTGCFLKWLMWHDGTDYDGRWAVVTELGTADVIVLAKDACPHGGDGPTADTIWTTLDTDGKWCINDSISVVDNLCIASIVVDPIVVIGDNINALKWASVDAITPGNKHVRTAYHWVKEHVRDGHICIRDAPSVMNLSDFLTKNMAGPHARQLIDAASGYSEQPPIPDKLKFII